MHKLAAVYSTLTSL